VLVGPSIYANFAQKTYILENTIKDGLFRRMKKFWLASVLSFSCLVTSGLSAADLDVGGMNDDVAATVILNRWLSDIGYTTKLQSGEKQLFIEEGKMDILPRVSTTGVDRLIVYKLFRGKPSNANSLALKEIVREINNRFNVCSSYVDDDGDLHLRFVIMFDDKMTPKLFRLSLDHIKNAVTTIITEYRPKFKPYYD